MPKFYSPMSIFFLYLAFSILIPHAQAQQSTAQTEIPKNNRTLWDKARSNITNGCFLLETNQNLLISYNTEQHFTPASIWKLATAATAFYVLGDDYRFKTEFYQDKTGALYIKGYGDPFLVSEEIDLIAKELKKNLDQPINAVYIDQSSFALPLGSSPWQKQSDNPYDARNFALSVNFNTINVSISQEGIARSAESQTPTLAIMQRLTNYLSAGKKRINISQEGVNVNAYIHELFIAKTVPNLQDTLSIQEIEKPTPSSAKLIYRHFSTKKLDELVRTMLLYSNNFMANQLFLTSGAKRYGYPATWHKAQMMEEDFLTSQIGIDKKDFNLTEGSGLARSNKITGSAMLKIMKYFKPHTNLLPKKKGSWIKSGTMTGVYTYAGYINNKSGPRPFVIILNQRSNTRNNILDSLTLIH